MRDMTRKQFLSALQRNGMVLELGALGYVRLNVPGQNICVSYMNSPVKTWRGALAYLLKQQERRVALHEAELHTKEAAL